MRIRIPVELQADVAERTTQRGETVTAYVSGLIQDDVDKWRHQQEVRRTSRAHSERWSDYE